MSTSSASSDSPKRIPHNYEENLTPTFREPRFCEIGYTGADFFDHNHADYDVCCGCCHTKNSGKVLSILSLFGNAFIAWLMYDRSSLFIALVCVCGVCNVLHVYAVFSERPILMIPYLLCALVLQVSSMALLTMECTDIYWSFKNNDIDDSFSGLIQVIIVLLIAPYCALTWWILCTFVVHYFYIRNKPRSFDLATFMSSSPQPTLFQRIRRNFFLD